MSEIRYSLEHFNEQIGFWEGLAPDMVTVAYDFLAIPDVGSWWPGLEEYFAGKEAKVINDLVNEVFEVVEDGANAAKQIGDLLRKAALDYARTETENEEAAKQIWGQLIDDPPPSTSPKAPDLPMMRRPGMEY